MWTESESGLLPGHVQLLLEHVSLLGGEPHSFPQISEKSVAKRKEIKNQDKMLDKKANNRISLNTDTKRVCWKHYRKKGWRGAGNKPGNRVLGKTEKDILWRYGPND